jgi:RimJ/RimL family protein N-acetyltransferase
VRFAIETKHGRHIGMIGLHELCPEDRNAELGIMIGEKDFWSRGYGADALMTLLRFAFDNINLHRLKLGVCEFNERAQACCRRCGFLEEGRFREEVYKDGRYWDVVRMPALEQEFRALHGAADEKTTSSAGG